MRTSGVLGRYLAMNLRAATMSWKGGGSMIMSSQAFIHRLHRVYNQKRFKLRRSRMFIATSIRKRSKLRRSETKVRHTLRSYGASNPKPRRIYKHYVPLGL